MRKKWSMCICLLFTACMLLSAGCGTNTTADDQGTDLLVYYVKDHDYYGEALGAFIYSHSKYDITLQAFESDEDMCNQLATEIAAGQGPDVVLLSSESDFDIYKAVKSGNIADLSSYFENDEEFAVENYYESVFDGGIISGGQYLVPFTFGMESLFVNKTVMEEVGADLDSIDNFDDILFLCEAACEAADDETIGIMITSGKKILTNNYIRYLIISGIDLIDADGKVSDSISQSQKAMDFISLTAEDFEKKREVYAQITQTADISRVLTISVCDNVLYEPLMAAVYTADNAAGDVYVSLSWKNISGQPQPVVCDYGFVNQNSKSKGAAYDMLRYLMDYDVPQGLTAPISVNREIVDKQLSLLQERETTLNGKAVKLKQEESEKTKETLDNMATAIVYNTGYYDIAIDQLTSYYGSGDKETTLADLKSELTRYLRE